MMIILSQQAAQAVQLILASREGQLAWAALCLVPAKLLSC